MKNAVLGLLFVLMGLLSVSPARAQAPTPAPLPASVQASPPLTGKIARISIVGNNTVSESIICQALTEKVGDPFSPPTAEKDRAAIQKLGFFNGTVRLTAAPDIAGGVDVTYTVSEYPIVKSIVFTANTPDKEPTIPSAELLAQMKLKVGMVLNVNVLKDDLDGLFNHSTGYAIKQGYLIDVSSDINVDPKTGVVQIPLVEAYVQTVQVKSTQPRSPLQTKTTDILAQMHTRSGSLYNANTLQKDIAAIYETGEFKTVNETWTMISPGQVSVIISLTEQEASTLGGLDEKQGKTVPFLYDPVTNPFPVVQVSVNGQPPLPFMVDTGAGAALSLAPWAADKLGLKTHGLIDRTGDVPMIPVSIQGVVLQGTTRDNDVVFNIDKAYIFDLSNITDFVQGEGVAGIVGLEMLSQVTTRFDFVAKTMSVFAYAHPPLHIFGATVRPLRSTPDGRVTVHVSFAPGIADDLILDTGSNSTQVSLSAMEALHPNAISSTFSQRYDSSYIGPELHLPGLTLGSLWIPNVTVDTQPPATPLSLGLNVLARYRLTLDVPNGQLIFEPALRTVYKAFGWSGIYLKPSGRGWSVKSLQAHSPAQLAGMQVGDQIVSINGESVEGLSRLWVAVRLGGSSGMPLQVSLRRSKSKTLQVSWIPRDDFSAPDRAIDGLTMEKANGGPWVILNVLKGCPGDLAGLQTGDQITHFNGLPVADMTLDKLEEITEPSSLAVTVTRMGRAEPFVVTLTAPPETP